MAGIFSFGGMLIMLSLALSNVLTLTYIQKQVTEEMQKTQVFNAISINNDIYITYFILYIDK